MNIFYTLKLKIWSFFACVKYNFSLVAYKSFIWGKSATSFFHFSYLVWRGCNTQFNFHITNIAMWLNSGTSCPNCLPSTSRPHLGNAGLCTRGIKVLVNEWITEIFLIRIFLIKTDAPPHLKNTPPPPRSKFGGLQV